MSKIEDILKLAKITEAIQKKEISEEKKKQWVLYWQ